MEEKRLERFIEWLEKQYGRKPVPEDEQGEFVVWVAHDLRISHNAARFYLLRSTDPDRFRRREDATKQQRPFSSSPMQAVAGCSPLKVGDRVRMRAQGTAGDPDGTGAQVVLNAEITGIIENIHDTNVAFRVEPSPVRGEIPRTRTLSGERRELQGERHWREVGEIARSYVQAYEEFLVKFPGEKVDANRMLMWFTDAVMQGNNYAVEAMQRRHLGSSRTDSNSTPPQG